MVLLWDRLKLTEEEGTEVHVDDRMKDNINLSGFFCLIESLWNAKKFNKENFKNTMKTLWQAKRGLGIRDVEYNLFFFLFNNDDRLKVLKLGPWLFDKHILLSKKNRE
ncbi:DUF4283 domain-containing protein [Cephalotus follicularis]|uniref:DUF4283 domain-containing protein n=1 Tax=Cephalotus follicularis TaxID=3775 RepID=A0A1Q3CBH1_CEPFO|nr:DUF4283 domain-containing protein [Cephalotus follicularis]